MTFIDLIKRRDVQILLGITALAIVIRSIPAWLYPAWGADLGIYYGITKDFVKDPVLFKTYSGWGSSYEYFPVLYVTGGGIAMLTGWDPMLVLQRVAPIFGGLCAPIVYYLALELFGSKRVALLAAAFIAVNPFHIYQTSHAAPHTMGHFFLALSFYLFVRYRSRPSMTGPLYLSTILLLGSHHLGMYMFIVSIVFVTFWRNLRSDKWRPKLKEDLFFIFATSIMAFVYWMMIAVPVYRTFMRSASSVSPGLIILLFYVGLAILFGLVLFRRRLGWSVDWIRPIPRENAPKVFSTVLFMILPVAFWSYHYIYGTLWIFDPMATIYLLPTFFIYGLAVAGWKYGLFKRRGGFVDGWLWVLLGSMAFGAVTNNGVLYPFRHVEYLAYPISLMAALGADGIWKDLKRMDKKRERDPSRVKIFAALLAVLIISSAGSAYSVQTSTSKAHEEIHQEVFDTIEWMEGNITKNQTIATDHRISQILWAKGHNATSDDMYMLWFSDDWHDSVEELRGEGKGYERVSYVLIDDVMRNESVIVNINETYRPINDTNYEKFGGQPFELIDEGSFMRVNGAHWTELYWVNWTYIEENHP